MPDDEWSDVEIKLAMGRMASPFGVVKWSPDRRSIAAAGGPDVYGDSVVCLWRLGGSEPMVLRLVKRLKRIGRRRTPIRKAMGWVR